MKIKAVSFCPLKYEVDGMESPVEDIIYKDENGIERKLSYLIINGEKFPVEHRVELSQKLSENKVDEAIASVEAERIEKENK